MQRLPKVLILYTGGTFGMDFVEKKDSNSPLLSLPNVSASILKKKFTKAVPELSRLAQCEVEVVLNCDSSHIGPPEWVLLAGLIQANWKKYDGFVILHGTDTLAFTASALSFLLKPCHKPVVLTGAQRPLAALRNDARTNLISAVEIAAHGPRPLVNQVTVFFGDKLFQGNRVQKKSATDYIAFESPLAPPLAQVGTTIRYADLSPSTVRTLRAAKAPIQKIKPEFSSKVLLLHITPAFPSLELCAGLLPELDGIVLVAYPSGTAPTHLPQFIEFLEEAKRQHLPMVVATYTSSQSPEFGVQPTQYPSGLKLLKHGGCLPAGKMTPECAFVKASLILGQKPRNFRTLWLTDFSGEGGS